MSNKKTFLSPTPSNVTETTKLNKKTEKKNIRAEPEDPVRGPKSDYLFPHTM